MKRKHMDLRKPVTATVTVAALALTVAGIRAELANFRKSTPHSLVTLAAEATSETAGTEEPTVEETVHETETFFNEPVRSFTEEEKYVLKKIAMAEAEGESTVGKALVMLVVLNRADDPGFPDTVREVVFEEGQFSSLDRYGELEPNEDCEEALLLIENGWDESEGALYFESCRGESWHSRNLTFLFREGGHRFYR
ncbi:cell wall hydrolase [bacterium]|nr:cell wall hydrolase [bacterium]